MRLLDHQCIHQQLRSCHKLCTNHYIHHDQKLLLVEDLQYLCWFDRSWLAWLCWFVLWLLLRWFFARVMLQRVSLFFWITGSCMLCVGFLRDWLQHVFLITGSCNDDGFVWGVRMIVFPKRIFVFHWRINVFQ